MDRHRTQKFAIACALILLITTGRASAVTLHYDVLLTGSGTAIYVADSFDDYTFYAASPIAYSGADFIAELLDISAGTPVSVDITAPGHPGDLDLLVLDLPDSNASAHGVSLTPFNDESVNFIADGNIIVIVVDDSVGLGGYSFEMTIAVAAVPIPAAVWSFGSALGVLGWVRHKSA